MVGRQMDWREFGTKRSWPSPRYWHACKDWEIPRKALWIAGVPSQIRTECIVATPSRRAALLAINLSMQLTACCLCIRTWRDVTWRDVTWRDVTWRDETWRDVTWRDETRRDVTWRDVTWRDVTWRDVTWRDVTWRDVTWHDMTS
jgi:hypothetical protein